VSTSRRSFGTRRRPATAWSFAFVAIAAFGGVAAALVSQHVYGMDPCAWCVLQRLIFVAIGIVAVLGLVWRRPPGARVAGAILLLLSLAGIASALWQQFVASKSASCNLTLADRIVSGSGLDQLLPGVFEARASCADAAVSLLRVPYALWAAALFALCAIAAIRTLRLAR
jgi:disulfide bond formation protein DsbB